MEGEVQMNIASMTQKSYISTTSHGIRDKLIIGSEKYRKLMDRKLYQINNYANKHNYKVSHEWNIRENLKAYENFTNWGIASNYNPKIMRIHLTAGSTTYSPDTCEIFNTRIYVQSRRYICYDNLCYLITDWAKALRMTSSSLAYRIDKSGMAYEDAVLTPSHSNTQYTIAQLQQIFKKMDADNRYDELRTLNIIK